MRHRILLPLLLLLAVPMESNAGGSPRIWGQSRTHHITFADDVDFSHAKIVIKKASSEDADAYDKTVLEIPFRDVCVASEKEIRCSPQGKSIVAGVVYRLTPDGSPVCFGATYQWRYTCIRGCRKELPRYLSIDPYEC